METLTKDILAKKKCPELKQLCKERKLPCSGTKAVLIARLLGLEPPPDAAPKKRGSKQALLETKYPPAIKYLLKQAPSIVVPRGADGTFEHKETGFIFNPETKLVIGRRDDKGIINLKISDLAVTKEYGFAVDESRVDKEFATDNKDRLKELLEYMDDELGEDSNDES